MYGGTKEEMARLITDAAKLDKTVKANDMSFGNIVKAIHAVQTEMGITGTTMKEASSTISGSIGMVKSSFSNMLTGLVDENANFGELTNQFSSSVSTAYDNLVPRIWDAMSGIIDLFDVLAPKMAAKIPEVAAYLVPQLIGSAGLVINTLLYSLIEQAPALAQAAYDIVLELANFLEMNLPLIIEAAVGIINELVNTLCEPDNLKTLVNSAIAIITSLANALVTNLPVLIEAAITLVSSLATQLVTAENIEKIATSAVEIVIALAGALVGAVPQIIDAVGEIISNIATSFKNHDWGETGKKIMKGIKDGLKSSWTGIKDWFNNKWDNLFSGRKVNIGANIRTDGSHAGGLDYVPYNGYVATLHRGERVITADENKNYQGGGGKAVNVTQNIYSKPMSAADLMQAALNKQRQAVFVNV